MYTAAWNGATYSSMELGSLTGARMKRMVYLKAVSSRLWFCTTSAHITSVMTDTVTSMAANPDEWRKGASHNFQRNNINRFLAQILCGTVA